MYFESTRTEHRLHYHAEFRPDMKLAVQCLDQTTGVQKRKYRHRARETVLYNEQLGKFDACPQAGSLLKASRVFQLKQRQNGQTTA